MSRTWFTAILVLGLLLFSFWAGLQQDDSHSRMQDARLPDNAVPTHYQVELHLDPEKSHFTGKTLIQLTLKNSTNQILLHGRDLQVTSVDAIVGGGRRVHGRWRQLSDSGLARLDFADVLPTGNIAIEVAYVAAYNEHLQGIYRVQANGEWYVFSQFESIDARRAFPCFDEPRFKTPFAVHITTPRGLAAFSTMSVSDVHSHDRQQQKFLFSETPRLPTYLLAIAVGKLEFVEAPAIPANAMRDRAIPLRGIAIQGQAHRLRKALEHTAPLITAMEQYFGVQYPFEKLDLLAVPDSSTDAMEHAGLVTFRDATIFMDSTTPLFEEREIIATMGHELAHQWFGNLVTMPWWNDLWLKESFATWIGIKAAQMAFPEYDFALYSKMQTNEAMFDDARNTQRSLRAAVTEDEQVDTMYDYHITYLKGAGVLSMFENYIGAKTFQMGLRNYFARYAFGTATAEDFMRAVGESTGNFDMPSSIASFLRLPGLPNVIISQQCKNEHVQLHITQQRYLLHGSNPLSDEQWKIPFCVSLGVSEENKFCRVIDAPEVQWEIPAPCDQAVMPNANGAGYFRWQLDAASMDTLLQRFNQLTPTEAVDVAANLSASFYANKLDINRYLSIMPKLTHYPHPHVNGIFVNDARWILRHLTTPKNEEALRHYFLTLFGRRIMEYDVRPADYPSMIPMFWHSNIWPFMALDARDQRLLQPLMAAARQQFGNDFTQPERPGFLANELKDSAFSTLVQEQGAVGTQAILSRLKIDSDPIQRRKLLLSFVRHHASTEDQNIYALFFDKTMRSDEKMLLLRVLMYSSRHSQHMQWFMKNAADVMGEFPEHFRKDIPGFISHICDEKQLQIERAFYQDQTQSIPGSQSAFDAGTESAQQCIALRQVQPAINTEALYVH